MWNLRFVFLYRDIDKYGHADIGKYGDFWLKYILLYKYNI